MQPHRTTRLHLLALAALCAITYFLGLTSHGLTNFQEAQRVLVARQMHERGDWLVPTLNDQPYLAKPPMVYWCQLTIARIRGGEPGELDLRLTVALAGLLGVLATYLVARRLLHDDDDPAFAPTAAFWASLMLATGILYVRSSRIGELDILLVPFVVIAIGAIAAAWRTHRLEGKTHFAAVIIATLAAIGAAMTKGPPGILVIALAAYGGIAWYTAVDRSLAPSKRARSLLITYSRTHPIAVLGAPLVVLWLWGRMVQGQIGSEAVMAAAGAEAEDNLRFFVAQAPLKNLEAISYGVGLGSFAAIAALIAWIRFRPRIRAMWFIPVAWVVLSLIAFSVLGKGVPRYLTPVWPGVAIIGGMFVALASRRLAVPRRLTVPLGIGIVVLAASQSVWYGYGREARYAWRSPRAFMAELDQAVGPDEVLGSFEFWTPAAEFYAGRRVQPIGDVRIRPSMSGGSAWTLEELAQRLCDNGSTVTVLARTTQPGDMDQRSAVDRLAAAGLVVQEIPLSSLFKIDSGRHEVRAFRVSGM